MTITPVERRRLSDAVVDQLTQLIRSGAYAAGERLPSERELAKRLCVSRALVRESIRALESLGLVAVKPGIGAIVAEHSRKSADIAHYLWTHPAEVLEVVDVREALHARACELAAQRITDDELATLARLYAEQREAVARGAVADLVRLDEEFHDLIYRAARNTLLQAMQDYSRETLNNVRWNVLTLATRQARAVAEHGRIVAALQARDARGAALAARRHDQRSNAEIRKLVQERMSDSAGPQGDVPAR
ncbi:MAG TPA: FadR/GntR family transcriptional regulator [Thermomicrobiales bacterium]|nr:FadR/GntR family transcriptional regulator [Thermomicrobiales bacterium]